MAKTILVTGACGFIGWKTSALLLENGYRVVGADNMNDYYDTRLKEYRLNDLKKNGDFEFHALDIEDLGALERLFGDKGFSGIVNLAARAGVRHSLVDPFVYLRTNAMGTLNLLELARRHGVGKFVLASTSSLYAGQPMPFRESLPVNTPISPYAASKKSAEALAYTYHYLYGTDVTVLRYFTVYGPAGRPDMSCFRFIKWIDEGEPLRIFGDGTQKRDFTYVDDVACGTLKALETQTAYEVINLGNNNPHELNYIIELIEGALGKKAVRLHGEFHRADMQATWADIEKARTVLGWEPKVSLEDGILKTVHWHVENRDWLRTVRV